MLAEGPRRRAGGPAGRPFTREVVRSTPGVEAVVGPPACPPFGTSPGRADGVCAHLDFPVPRPPRPDRAGHRHRRRPRDRPWRPSAWPGPCSTWSTPASTGTGSSSSPSASVPPTTTRPNKTAASPPSGTWPTSRRWLPPAEAMVLAWHERRDEDGDGGCLDHHLAWQAELWRRLRARWARLPRRAHRRRLRHPARRPVTSWTRPSALPLRPHPACRPATSTCSEALAVHRTSTSSPPCTRRRRAGAPRTSSPCSTPAAGVGQDSRDGRRAAPAPAEAPHAATGTATTPPDGGRGRTFHLAAAPPPQAAIRADGAPPTDPAERVVLDAGDRSIQVHACHGRARPRCCGTPSPTCSPRTPPSSPATSWPCAPASTSSRRSAGGLRRRPDHPRAIPTAWPTARCARPTPVPGGGRPARPGRRPPSPPPRCWPSPPSPVRQRFGFDEDDLGRLAEWVEQTGTRWGLDGDHRAPYDLAAVARARGRPASQRVLLGVAMTEDHLRLVGGVLPSTTSTPATSTWPPLRRAGRPPRRRGALARRPRPVGEWVAALDQPPTGCSPRAGTTPGSAASSTSSSRRSCTRPAPVPMTRRPPATPAPAWPSCATCWPTA